MSLPEFKHSRKALAIWDKAYLKWKKEFCTCLDHESVFRHFEIADSIEKHLDKFATT